jgi:hypothetical protein
VQKDVENVVEVFVLETVHRCETVLDLLDLAPDADWGVAAQQLGPSARVQTGYRSQRFDGSDPGCRHPRSPASRRALQ